MTVISNRNASLYCEQLATLIGGGVPLDRALTTLGRSAPTLGLRRISSDIRRFSISGHVTNAGANWRCSAMLPGI